MRARCDGNRAGECTARLVFPLASGLGSIAHDGGESGSKFLAWGAETGLRERYSGSVIRRAKTGLGGRFHGTSGLFSAIWCDWFFRVAEGWVAEKLVVD